MRCYICDAAIAEIQFNSDLDQFEPCERCLQISLEAAGAHQDKPYAEDEDGAFFEPSAYDMLAEYARKDTLLVYALGQLSEAG